MSVVVWDGKVLAADKQVTHQNGIKGTTTKIMSRQNKLLGFAGEPRNAKELCDWIYSGFDPETFIQAESEEDFVEAVYIEKTETGVVLLSFNNLHPVPIIIEDEVFAIGSGSELALGALSAGCTAQQAVAVASSYDIYCGMGCDYYELDGV